MPFSQATITGVAQQRRGNEVFISWTSTSPAGTNYQVYAGRRLAWSGPETSCSIMIPAGTTRVAVGAVGPSEARTDFAASLPPPPNRRVQVGWTGGTAEAPDIAGFRVYMGPAPGSAVDYSGPVASIAAEPGVASGSYRWTSGNLASGAWSFGVRPYDSAGNEGPTQEVTAAVTAPPAECPPFGDGAGLHYAVLDPGEATGVLPQVVLQWNPSPG